MTERTFRYPAELRAALEDHGVSPSERTPPDLVRAFLNDLYRYEIRRLKQRHLDGLVSKADYVPKVIELRKKYFALSFTLDQWRVLVQR